MKQSLVKVCRFNSIFVYTDEPEKEVAALQKVEGVLRAYMIINNPIFVDVDPRYDKAEVAKEIEMLLTAEVPDVFKDENSN